MPSASLGQICTSIPATSAEIVQSEIEKAFNYGSDYVEIRFDYLNELNIDDFKNVLSVYGDKCVLTCRKSEEGGRFRGGEEARLKLLQKLSDQNPAFIDIELKTAEDKFEWVDKVRTNGVSIIVSWHNFQETPCLELLKNVQKKASTLGDIVKIVTFANRFKDNSSVLSLYKSTKNSGLIAFCMGELGVISRIFCVFLGSPWTYACLDKAKIAPGQIPVRELREFYDAL